MWKYVVYFGCYLVIIKGYYSSAVTQKCPENEIFTDCVGCENTCEYPDSAVACSVGCLPGCICKQGFFRNTSGICVEAKFCDTCNGNEIFDACGNTNCVNTCLEPNKSATCLPDRCIAGCICKSGFLRNDLNFCVAPTYCDSKCTRPNEELSVCPCQYPKTCKNKDQECTPDCRAPQCVCKNGYIRGWSGACIHPEECPTCPGSNEIYDCLAICDPECATLGDECTINNEFSKRCITKCYCKDGFARDEKGTCIPIDKCPPRQCKTDPNAIIVPCGDPCPLTCDNKDQTGPRPCPEICIVNGCKCKGGYVLGKDGKCILTKDCPPKMTVRCKKNELFTDRLPLCPPENTCNLYMSGIAFGCPTTFQNKSGCICKEGYIRNDIKECVLPAQCCKDPNSELVSNPNPCNGGTCAKPEFDLCALRSPRFGCQCKKGFLKRSDRDSRCVPIEFCNKKIL